MKDTNKKIEIVDKESQPKKKRSLKVKLTAWIIISLFIMIYGLPFIVIGVFIGKIIWK